MTLFQTAYVLLTIAGNSGKLFLRQTFLLSDPPDVPPNQFAHVHAQRSADYTLESYQL